MEISAFIFIILFNQSPHRANFVDVERRLGGVAEDEDEDDGGEDGGHGVVSPGDRGLDHSN